MRLNDLKKTNKRQVVSAVLEHGSLSRIEISRESGLSPSTVSGLVSALIDEGVLIETGNRISTGGRGRVELALNGALGIIATVEIGRGGIVLTLFDFSLESVAHIRLANTLIQGNDLLLLIQEGLVESLDSIQKGTESLLGIGLIFQKDMRSDDFNVMYSTGIQQANITLTDALFTQFKVPVIEEYSQEYTLAHAMRDLEDETVSAAVVSIGSEVVASVMVDSNLVPLKKGSLADITPMVCGDASCVLAERTGAYGALAAMDENERACRVANAVVALCTLFSLEGIVLLAPDDLVSERFVKGVEVALGRALGSDSPWLKWLCSYGSAVSPVPKTCAVELRSLVLSQE